MKKLNIPEQTVKEFLDIILNENCDDFVIDNLKKYKGKNETFDLGYDELNSVIYYIEKFGVPQKNYRIDLTIARGLDYYTGTVYETTLDKHPEIGSICSGGRYDNLAEYYTANKFPGVGMSIGLTRLFYILREKEYINDKMSNPADVLIIPMTDDFTKCVETATALRENKISVQIFTEKKKVKYMLSYADKLSIPYAVFIGEDEINSNILSVKKMESGVQESLSLDETISMIKNEKNKNSLFF